MWEKRNHCEKKREIIVREKDKSLWEKKINHCEIKKKSLWEKKKSLWENCCLIIKSFDLLLLLLLQILGEDYSIFSYLTPMQIFGWKRILNLETAPSEELLRAGCVLNMNIEHQPHNSFLLVWRQNSLIFSSTKIIPKI